MEMFFKSLTDAFCVANEFIEPVFSFLLIEKWLLAHYFYYVCHCLQMSPYQMNYLQMIRAFIFKVKPSLPYSTLRKMFDSRIQQQRHTLL